MFEDFVKSLETPRLVEDLRAGLIGEGAPVEGPFGSHPLIYADYVGSGRALRQIEHFVLDKVLPFYANSHSEASYCGAYATRIREAARETIGRLAGAGPEDAVIFAGPGATAGINRLVRLWQVADRVRRGERIVVLTGPYEHHSNILPWRESGAPVVELAEGPGGGPDPAALQAALKTHGDADLVVGAFSAASNVTGIVADVAAITRMLKRHGALAVWDYAGGAPYLEMAMDCGDGSRIDALVFSPHKFPGGPGASGVLIMREDTVAMRRPTAPGGGSVRFVSPWAHDYSDDLAAREEAGTPNILGDIRAALVMLVKEAVGQDFIDNRDRELRERALSVWTKNPQIEILGDQRIARLPIFSFRVRDAAGDLVHHQLVTRMLSDVYGIQARGGCACAGPYAHRLLGIDEAASNALRQAICSGREIEKPGWVRLNLSYLMSDATADKIIAAVGEIALKARDIAAQYRFDPETARFSAPEAA